MVPDFNMSLQKLSQANSWEDFDHELSYLDLPEQVDGSTNQIIAQVFEEAHKRLGNHTPLKDTDINLYDRILKTLSRGEEGKHKYHALAAVRTLMGPNMIDMPVEIRDTILRNLSYKDRARASQVDQAFKEGVEAGIPRLLIPFKELVNLANTLDSIFIAKGEPSLFLDESAVCPNGYVEFRLTKSSMNRTLEDCYNLIVAGGENLEATLNTERWKKLYLPLLGALAERNVLPNGDILDSPFLDSIVVPEEFNNSEVAKKLLAESQNCFMATVYPLNRSARASNLTATSTEVDFKIPCTFVNEKSLPQAINGPLLNFLSTTQEHQFREVLPDNRLYVTLDLFSDAKPGDLIYFPPHLEGDCGFVIRVPNDRVFYQNIQTSLSTCTISNSEIPPIPLILSMTAKFVTPEDLAAPPLQYDHDDAISNYSGYSGYSHDGDDDYQDLGDDDQQV